LISPRLNWQQNFRKSFGGELYVGTWKGGGARSLIGYIPYLDVKDVKMCSWQ